MNVYIFYLKIFFSNKNKLVVWESIHPLPVTVRKEQHIYIKKTELGKILIQYSSTNINKLKVKTKKGECRAWIINFQNDSS